MKMIKLPKRLAAIASYINNGERVADVGTDHGYIPVHLAQTGLAAGIIASDIGEGPLSSARRSAGYYGVTDKIKFVAAPGLSGIAKNEVDSVIIAGMGGETIIEILKDEPLSKLCGLRFILQPQSKTEELFTWLTGNGYIVRRASLVYDSGRYYIILITEPAKEKSCGIQTAGDSASAGNQDQLSAYLTMLAKSCDPLLPRYLDMLISKTRRVIIGMEKSYADSGGLTHMRERLDILLRMKNMNSSP